MPKERVLDLTIRAARTSDAAALATLMCELGYETNASEMQMRLTKIMRDRRYRTFVATQEGRVRGMIGTFVYDSFEHNQPGGRILALVVAKTSRRTGVARQLLTAAENDFAQRNITRVAVNTRFERKDAHAFYESAGYAKNGFRFVKTLAASVDK